MIDTTTVNYTLNKMEDLYQKIAPSVGQVSEKYIQYVMWKELTPFLYSIFTSMFSLIFIPIFVFIINKAEPFDKENMPTCIWGWIGIIGFVVSCVVFILNFICFLVNVLDALIVYNNPEMFAIQEFLKTIK